MVVVRKSAKHHPTSPPPPSLKPLLLAAALLDAEVRVGPPRALPLRFGVVVYTDASEAGWGVVVAHGGGWWGAWGEWDPAAAREVIFFLELRAALRGVELAHDRLGLRGIPLLLRVDNLPAVQAAARGCSSTALGNRLLARLDALADSHAAGVAVEWVPTDRQLADPFSRVLLGAAPPGCGASGDLVAIAPPFDPMGRPPPEELLFVPGADARIVNAAPLRLPLRRF